MSDDRDSGTEKKEYTHHISKLELDTGESRVVEWDSMNEKSDRIVFKRYTGYDPDSKTKQSSTGFGSVSTQPQIMFSTSGGFTSEAFLMVPLERVVWFETIDRETRAFEYTTEDAE